VAWPFTISNFVYDRAVVLTWVNGPKAGENVEVNLTNGGATAYFGGGCVTQGLQPSYDLEVRGIDSGYTTGTAVSGGVSCIDWNGYPMPGTCW
jgi:hypothetical protein